MTEPAIRLDHVWKRFRRGYHVRTVAELALGLPRRLFTRRNEDGLLEHEFWALRDLDLTVPKGETLGILGPNGAGKSTILKLLFRILRPDRGEVIVAGRVGGLIELGAGFHPYLSGRENVFINGAILGMRQREIRQQYDSIVEFAGIPDFMGMPVKNFSSGMYARLAFAIAAHARPDVLLVDEVLAVGDAEFQAKCYDWMGKRRREGTTIIQISHNLYTMSAADRCLHLDEGRVRMVGKPDEVIESYTNGIRKAGPSVTERTVVSMPDGKPRAEVHALEVLNAYGEPVAEVRSGEGLKLRFHWRCAEPVQSPIFALTFNRDDLRAPISSPRYLLNLYSGDLLKGKALHGAGVVEVAVPELRLPSGSYRLKTYIFEEFSTNIVFMEDGVAMFEVLPTADSDGRSLLDHRQDWQMLESAVPEARP